MDVIKKPDKTKKNVHSDKAAHYVADLQVKQHHPDHRYRAQPIQIRAVRNPARSSCVI